MRASKREHLTGVGLIYSTLLHRRPQLLTDRIYVENMKTKYCKRL